MIRVWPDKPEESSVEAPVAEWKRSHNLLYTLTETGRWERGKPVEVNRLMVSVSWDPRYATDAEGDALVARLHDFLRAAPAEARSVEVQEPSAWLVTPPSGDPRVTLYITDIDGFRDDGWKIEPLYALPTPPKAEDDHG